MSALQDLAARFHGQPWHSSPEDTFEFFSAQLARRFGDELVACGRQYRIEDDGLTVVVLPRIKVRDWMYRAHEGQQD